MTEHDHVEDRREGDTESVNQEPPPEGQTGAPANGISGLPPDASVQLGNPDPEHGGAH